MTGRPSLRDVARPLAALLFLGLLLCLLLAVLSGYLPLLLRRTGLA